MGRSPSRDESGLKKGPWTPEEDEKLVNYIQEHGHGSWRALPKLAGLNRCGKSCRLRWTNYLRPDIKRGKFSEEEEQIILKMHSVLGNKWSAIAGHLPGRTDNEIKNFWNTHLKKKLIQMGIDPMTHRPRTDIFSSLPQLLALASLRELIGQYSWDENALRLQAETTQMAIWLQNLQSSMTQPPQASPLALTIPNNSTHFTDMETMNMLNSLSSIDGNSVSNSHVQSFLGDSSLQGVLESIPFSHLPDLQDPSSDQTSPNKQMLNQASHDFTLFSHGECSSNSQWIPPSANPPSNPIGIPTEHNIGNNSSNEGVAAPVWDDLLFEDPWFHENA